MWRIGLAFLVGHCCIHLMPILPAASWVGVAVAIGLLGAFRLRAWMLASFVLGVGWAWCHAYLQLENDLPPWLEGEDIVVEGRIASMLDAQELDPQFDFDVIRSNVSEAPDRLRIAWYDADVTPQPGELWRLVVRLKRRNGFANPGGFDYEGHLFRARIGATGYVRQDPRNSRLAGASAQYSVLRIRAWLANRIERAVDDSSMLGILQGLAVGDTRAMTTEQWQVFAATGTSHLMAISGLHITMVAALAAWLGGQIVRWRAAQSMQLTAMHGQAAAGIAAALGYSLLAGMSVPTQRTLIMLVVYFAARWSRRTASVGQALGAALVAVLVVDPFGPLSPGFWLSFGAVIVIVATTAGRLRAEGSIVNFARVQWGVTIGLVPILVMVFGNVSLVSPIANAVAIPFFTLVVVPLVLFGTALAAVSVESGGLLLGLASQLLESGWPLLQWLAELPVAMWYLPELPFRLQALLVMAAALIVLPGVWPLRLSALVLVTPIVLFRPETPKPGDFEIVMLDVGQGLAMVVRTHRHTLVFDAGPAFRTGRDTGELVVLPYLRSRGVRTLDVLVVSHGDLDHQGGMQSVLSGIPTRSVLIGPSVNAETKDAVICTEGLQWVWDQVRFEILHPAPESVVGSDNDTSCVIRIAAPAGSALLTGDIEKAGEERLIERDIGSVDVVAIPHHGSRSSSTPRFVDRTRPRFALVSAGYRNRWGFPKSDVIERWKAMGSEIVSTIDSGAIELSVRQAQGIEVRRFRVDRRRLWMR